MAWDGTWTTAADLQGRLPRNILSQLRGAINERIVAVSSTPTTISELSAGMLPSTLWLSRFQGGATPLFGMTGLIPLFANHETNGGDYSGLTAIPVYTEASMLTALGDASRLTAPGAGNLLRNWSHQQYRMLNRMRWAYDKQPEAQVRQKTGSGATLNDAIAAFNSASWGAWGTATTSAYAAHYATESGGTYYVYRYAMKWTTPLIAMDSFEADIDVYPYFYRVGTTFEDNDYGASENTYYKVIGDQTVSTSASYVVEIGNIDTATVTAAGNGWRTSYTGDGFNKPLYTIYKFDVANGFAYKDW